MKLMSEERGVRMERKQMRGDGMIEKERESETERLQRRIERVSKEAEGDRQRAKKKPRECKEETVGE